MTTTFKYKKVDHNFGAPADTKAGVHLANTWQFPLSFIKASFKKIF